MTKTNPHAHLNSKYEGLTKREYFAAVIMQGLIAGGGRIPKAIAEDAVRCADTLINELNKKGNNE
jgi:hypothetical protein